MNLVKIEELLQLFKDEDLMDDRREYDVDEFMRSYPELTQQEAEELYNRVQNDE